MTPEVKARVNIDKMLIKAGYILQVDMSVFNRTAAFGVAVREFPTNSAPVDYMLFVDGKPIGVDEAKSEERGFFLSGVAKQSMRCAVSGLKHLDEIPNIRFTYETTNWVSY